MERYVEHYQSFGGTRYSLSQRRLHIYANILIKGLRCVVKRGMKVGGEEGADFATYLSGLCVDVIKLTGGFVFI